MADSDQSNQNDSPAPPKQGRINWTLIQNIGLPVLTLISGFGIGYLNFKTSNQTEIDSSKAQQAQYEDEIRKERSDFLQKYVPQLMSNDSNERKSAEALLFTLSLDEGPSASDVLPVIKHYQPGIDTVSPFANNEQQWGIVVGESSDSASAIDNVKKANEHGFTSVKINKVSDKVFQTVITGYKNKSAAMSQSFLARAALSDGARVENLNDLTNNNLNSTEPTAAPKK